MSKNFDFEKFVGKILIANLNTVQIKSILYLASDSTRYECSVVDIESSISKPSSTILRELKKLPLIDNFINYVVDENNMYVYVLNRSFKINFNKKIEASVSKEINEVFVFWRDKLSNKRAKLDSKRVSAIKKGLSAYSKDDCIKAINGCSKTFWNRGIDPKTGEAGGTKFLELGLIFRDSEKTERFINNDSLPELEVQIERIKSSNNEKENNSDNWAEKRLGIFEDEEPCKIEEDKEEQ